MRGGEYRVVGYAALTYPTGCRNAATALQLAVATINRRMADHRGMTV
jgi:hypothetical protein